jgi:hypothetical protein
VGSSNTVPARGLNWLSSRWGAVTFWVGSLLLQIGVYWAIWATWLRYMPAKRDPYEKIKIWILVVALLVLGLRFFWARVLEPRGGLSGLLSKRLVHFLMMGTLLAATFNYGRFGTTVILERVDTYDLIHYYLNVRYFEELGYTDLYPACIVADIDAGGPHFGNPATYLEENEAGYELKPFVHGVKKGETVKARFSDERWEAFSHDFLQLQRKMKGLDKAYWAQMLNDHGFNGTPAWLGVATPLARVVPVERVKLLGYIDVVLLIAAVGVTWRAFGGWSAAWLYLFLLTSYSTRWPTISWAYLRYDYLACLVIATGLIRLGKPFLAGCFSGHAAAMRVFPVMYLFGPGVLGLWRLAREKKIDRAVLLLAAGFAAWVLVLHGQAAMHWGVDTLLDYWKGMVEHVQPENLSTRRVGLSVALAYRGEFSADWGPERIARIAASQTPSRVVALLLLGMLGWVIRRRTSPEARAESFALGFVPFFVLTTASYYYYVVRAPLVLIHGASTQTRHVLGLALLIVIEIFSNTAQQYLGGNRIFLIGWLGWLLLAYTLFAIVALFFEDRALHRRATEAGTIEVGTERA